MMDVKFINAADTLEIRHYVLRPNQPFSACKYPGDNDPDTFHVGGFINGELVSIASLYKEKNPNLPNEGQYRLRGMATIQEHQHRGYARYLVDFILEELNGRKASLLWFNARRNAFPFYEKLGFKYFGNTFELEGIGPHKVMYKELDI